MSDDKTTGRFAITVPVVMTYPSLFEAKQFKRNGKAQGEPKFSASFMFEAESPDLKAMKTLAAQIARAAWPSRPFKDETGRALIAFPFQNGTKLADGSKAKNKDTEFQRGKAVIKGSSKYRPRLAVIDNGKLIDLENEALVAKYKGKFFFGAQVLAEFNFVKYDGVGQNPDGVTAYLNQVLSTGKGTRIGGGASAAETFKGYVGHASAEDPTGGSVELDDEIPF